MKPLAENTLIIGLTGQTGAGKSTVAKMFSDRGAAVLDADVIAHDTIDGSSVCVADLVLEFSTEIITADGMLNRKKLAQLCFSDKEKLRRLNEITYPHILRKIAEKMYEECLRGAQFLVLDAPTLYDAGLHERCDTVVAVLADQEVRCRRIMARDHISYEDAMTRIAAQRTDTFFTARADRILRNDQDHDILHLSFIELWGALEGQLRDKSQPPQPNPQPQSQQRSQLLDALPKTPAQGENEAQKEPDEQKTASGT